MRHVLVTGGSRGIGAAIVRAFTAAGDRVSFTYHTSHAQAQALSEACGALALCADSGDPAAVLHAVREAERQIGGVDVLINNAGVSSFRLFTDLTDEEWRNTMAVNLDGAFYYTRAVLPHMIHRKAGRILNISSIWGITGASCEVHYSTSKAALIGLTRALAKELGPSGITVNCIAPGVIETDMNRALSPETVESLCDETPLGRLGTAEEIASAAVFLASDGAAFITGQVLSPNGGICI
jgi:3-oxoacyl-[acyl-carrier protein] reductase